EAIYYGPRSDPAGAGLPLSYGRSRRSRARPRWPHRREAHPGGRRRPNLSGRELPYRVDSPRGDGLQAIEELAEQVVARGVRRIDGDIAGDDTAYVWDPYPDGWGLGDTVWEYGAPVSALTINDNAFMLQVTPGDPATISIAPPLEFYHIDNQVQEGANAKI